MKIDLSNRDIAVLDFSSHNAATASPKEVVALQVIESLDASNNRIRALVHLNVFVALKRLVLSHNKLSSPVVDWLKSMPPSLEELELSHNEISTFEARNGNVSTIGYVIGTYCPRLTVLSLSHNLLHASASPSQAAQRTSARNGMPSEIVSLNIDANTGVFSLNELLCGMPKLQTLSCCENHIETLEGVAGLSLHCPALRNISMRGCPVHANLQDVSFLWSVIGGDTFSFDSAAERREAQRDAAKLSPHFFAALVLQVLPTLETVDGVSVAEAKDLVGPLLSATLGSKSAQLAAPAVDSALPDVSPETNDTNGEEGSSASGSADEEAASSDAGRRVAFDDERHDEEHNVRDATADTTRTFEDLFHNSKLPKKAPHSDRSSKHVERVFQRLEYLHQRANELQAFIGASQRNTRNIQADFMALTERVHRMRQSVSEQRAELAAVRLQREAQVELLRSLQQLIRKKTLELDHAEVANIRVVERKVSSLIEQKEAHLRRHAVQQHRDRMKVHSLSGADAPPSLRKPTRSSLKQHEQAQRKLQVLRESSPTAALGRRFVYDEYGNPELAGTVFDAERFPESARRIDLDVSPPTRFQDSATQVSAAVRRSSASLPANSLQEGAVSGRRSSSSHVSDARRLSAARHQFVDPGVEMNDVVEVNVSLSPPGQQEPSYASKRRSNSLTDVHRRLSTTPTSPPRRLTAITSSVASAATSPLPPRSPKSRRIEPDHNISGNTTTLPSAVSADLTHSAFLEASQAFSAVQCANEATNASIDSFRFPMEPSPAAETPELLRDAIATRRASERLTLRLKPSDAPPDRTDSIYSDSTDSSDRAALADRITEVLLRRASTGHGVDGRLSHPLTSLPVAAEHSPYQSPSDSLVLATSAQASGVSAADGDTSIALQSPKKRLSESVNSQHEERRKPSSRILEEAAREIERSQLTSCYADDSLPVKESSRARSPMDLAEGMGAVPRGTHKAHTERGAKRVGHHPYFQETNLEFSLDESISRSRPNFRSTAANGVQPF